MWKQQKGPARGFTLIELLIVVAIIGILSAIAIPNLLGAQRRAKYSRASADTRTITDETILYAGDRNAYPPSADALQTAGYGTVAGKDPWGNTYDLGVGTTSPPTADTVPAEGDNIWSCSRGPSTEDRCKSDANSGVASASRGGSVGYSSVHGSWSAS